MIPFCRRLVVVLGLVGGCAVFGAADTAGSFSVSGSIEAGITEGWNPARLKGAFTVDQARLLMDYRPIPEVSLVAEPMAAYAPAPVWRPSSYNDGANYLSKFRVSSGNGFHLGMQQIFMEHRVSPHFAYRVGQLRVPFGMESRTNRIAASSYFYSAPQTLSHVYEWANDVGFSLHLRDVLPGEAILAITDGSRLNENLPRSLTLHYGTTIGGGGLFSFTPVVSAYLARFHGSPEEYGFTAGLGITHLDRWWLNIEAALIQNKLGRFAKPDEMMKSVYLEPGVRFGDLEVSAKLEMVDANFAAQGVNAVKTNMGFGASYLLASRARVRLLYQNIGLQPDRSATPANTLIQHTSDVRILFSTWF